MNEVYLGNPNLKKVNVTVEFTQEQIIEFEKCSKDPLYFIQNSTVTFTFLRFGLPR